MSLDVLKRGSACCAIESLLHSILNLTFSDIFIFEMLIRVTTNFFKFE